MPVRIVVSGAGGRMGQTIARLVEAAADLEAVGGIDREASAGAAGGYPGVATPEDAADLIREADVLLDFSAPGFLVRLLEAQRAALAGRAIVVGTTGLDEPVHRLLDRATADSAVLVAANFSIGVNVLLALAEAAARILPAERYDVEIVEAHHRGKADAPSGTALALGRAIAEGRSIRLDDARVDGRSGRTGARPQGEIGFHAIRGGGVAGDHRVLFLGDRERLELVHHATDRTLFAEGALAAVRWIAGRPPGRYGMREVVGIGAGPGVA